MNAKEAFNDVIRQFKKRGSTGFTCKEVYTQLRSKSVKISLDTVRGWLYESADNGELTSRLKGNSCIFSPVIKKIVQE
jgi:Fe2+ or Zn2+ uptake regulation protein